MHEGRRLQQEASDRTRGIAAWGGRLIVATVVVGVLASLALLGWVGWWALTTSVAAPHFPLPGVLSLMIVALWLGGCLTVIRHPWLATLLVLAAGVLVVSGWEVVPRPALLLAVSAGLAVWALLGWLARTRWRRLPWVVATGQRWWDLLGGRPLVRGLQQRLAPRRTPSAGPRCLICHLAAAGPDGFCAECGRWVRVQPEEWADASRRAPLRGHPRTHPAPADQRAGAASGTRDGGTSALGSNRPADH